MKAELTFSLDPESDSVTCSASQLAAFLRALQGVPAPIVPEPADSGVTELTEALPSLYSLDYVPKYPWGEASKTHLATCDPELIALANGIADIMNVSVIWGFRGKEDQNKAHADGNGPPWPQSEHNQMPSQAIDIVPYPLDWDDLDSFRRLRSAADTVVRQLRLRIRHGLVFSNYDDWPHFELFTLAEYGELITDWDK